MQRSFREGTEGVARKGDSGVFQPVAGRQGGPQTEGDHLTGGDLHREVTVDKDLPTVQQRCSQQCGSAVNGGEVPEATEDQPQRYHKSY